MPGDGWVRVGRQIEAERSRRWPNRADFAFVTGVSVTVILELEHGKRSNFRQSKLSQIEGALGYPPGAIRRAAQSGGRLTREIDTETTRLLDGWAQLPPGSQQREAVLTLIEALIAAP